jgi:hypothetical protein
MSENLFQQAGEQVPKSPAKGRAKESGLYDNRDRGKIVDFLREKITDGSELSIVSAYFTIYAYDCLREELDAITSLRFLFGEPRFISSLDPDKTDKKAFQIEDTQIKLSNQLEQKQIAQDCARLNRLTVDSPDLLAIIKRQGAL